MGAPASHDRRPMRRPRSGSRDCSQSWPCPRAGGPPAWASPGPRGRGGSRWQHNAAPRHSIHLHQRKRIYTEEKANVVAAVWGTELIQFLALLAILHQDDLKNKMNASFLHIIRVQFILFFISSWLKTASAAKNLIKSVPPKTAAST